MDRDAQETMSISARNVLDTLRIIDTREMGRDSYEICATGQATYDEPSSEMQVDLDSFVRRFEMQGKDQVLRPAWLPKRDAVKTHVSWEEAPDAAKEVFNSWAHKVQGAIPPAGEWQRDIPGCAPQRTKRVHGKAEKGRS